MRLRIVALCLAIGATPLQAADFTMKFGFKFDDAPPAEGEEGKASGSSPAPAR